MRLRRCGTDAVLVEVDSIGEVEAVRAAVRAADLPEVVELVPAARTVLVTARPGGLAAVRRVLDSVDLTHRVDTPSQEITIPVVYDGPDLELVAGTAGITTDEVVRLHAEATYSVAFCGFAPGFAYLVGLPRELHQPRLDSPRTKVPAGSVGVAGEYTAAYPRSTPGGWRLIGRTDAPLFDPRRAAPALLAPGDRVRFEAAG
ncbi:KipI family sensor histidine kinase inhibitor [Saccharothrix tamanrassetensis]|uniref:KipI family sensor histidine kinase inhibitor n=1 Tax=Saccharothrix tamanrassetensis TaxID=1051531 RepID=A0A841CB31_9PSEU|nr:5-oxoprolinase subunit PxpB [Saccharothrix tamanrassetensis]MBB5954609.1 KipI family sensor histidine kinase inhibitor [Saccharothrix tamanrassetensis]